MKLHRLILRKLYRRLDEARARNKRLNHRFDRIVSLVYAPHESSPLYFQNTPLHLPGDTIMIPYLLECGEWQKDFIDFARAELSQRAGTNYHLFDAGANVGLVTRQFLTQFPMLTGATCIEPDPGNFAFLQKNTEVFGRVTYLNYALSDQAGKSTFYRDSQNIGNYSLLAEAMSAAVGKPNQITIECLQATDELLLRNVDPASRLIWKSDTQGYDEIIATQLSLPFWERVDIAFMELWPIGKPKYDRAKLEAILDSFPRKYLIGQTPDFSKLASTQEIIAYTTSNDSLYRDLYMAR